jgi:hypothetical protein
MIRFLALALGLWLGLAPEAMACSPRYNAPCFGGGGGGTAGISGTLTTDGVVVATDASTLGTVSGFTFSGGLLTVPGTVSASGYIGNGGSLTAVATGGLTTRSAADARSDMLTVLDFGAVGDGVTDNRTAVQAAATFSINAGRPLVFPPSGTFVVGGQINVSASGKVFEVRGMGALVVYTSSTGNLFRVDSATTVGVQGLNVSGSFTPATSGGGQVSKVLWTTETSGFCYLRGNRVTGMSLGRLQECDSYEVQGNYATSGLPTSDAAFSSAYNGNHALSYGIFIRGSGQGRIIGNEFHAYVTDCIKLSAETSNGNTAEGHVIAQNIVEGCRNDDGVDIYDNGGKVSIFGNFIKNGTTGINAKRGDSEAETDTDAVNTISIYGNVIDLGGAAGYNAAAAQDLGAQQGISLNGYSIISSGNQITNVTGIGINFRDKCRECHVIGDTVVSVSTPSASDVTLGVGVLIQAGSLNSLVRDVNVTDAKGYAIYALTDDFRILGGSVVASTTTSSRSIFISPNSSGVRDAGFVVDGLRLVNRNSSAQPVGMRISANLITPSIVTGVRVYGSFTTPYQLDAADNLIYGGYNTWQRNAISATDAHLGNLFVSGTTTDASISIRAVNANDAYLRLTEGTPNTGMQVVYDGGLNRSFMQTGNGTYLTRQSWARDSYDMGFGIGDATPSATMHISGTVRQYTGDVMFGANRAGDVSGLTVVGAISSSNLVATTGSVKLMPGGMVGLAVSPSGNVGIGTEEPGSKLEVVGNIAASAISTTTGGSSLTAPVRVYTGNSTDGVALTRGANTATLQMLNSPARVVVNGSANTNWVLDFSAAQAKVGINTSSPNAALQVSGTSMLGTCNASIVCGVSQTGAICFGTTRNVHYTCDGAGSWIYTTSTTMVSASGSM